MTIIPYDPNNYAQERDNSTWTLILSRQDKKSQLSELLEYQTLINTHTGKSFSQLYSFYSIIRGLRLFVVNFNETTYDLILEGGQIYVETEYGSFFIDIDSENLTISNQERIFVGIEISFVADVNNPEHRNPQTGGLAFGTQGADRLLVQYNIVTGTQLDNAYPIAVVTPSFFEINNNQGACDVNYDVSVVVNYTTSAASEEILQWVPPTSPVTLQGPIISGWVYDAAGDVPPTTSNPDYRRRWGIKYQGGAVTPQVFDGGIPAITFYQIHSVDITPVLTDPGQTSNYCPAINNIYPQPNIRYYQDERFTTSRSEGIIPRTIRDMINLRLYEMAGDFIDTGLEVTRLKQFVTSSELNSDRLLIKISPGVAYIRGKRIELQYPTVLQLPTFDRNNINYSVSNTYTKFLIYMTEFGEINYIQEENNQVYAIELPARSIDLGQIDLSPYYSEIDNVDYSFSIINSKKVMPTVRELLSLIEQHEEDERTVLQLSLDLQTLNRGGNLSSSLSGIFTDSFTSLSKSDISNPLFSAAIIPALQAVRPSFSTFTKDYTNFTVQTTNNTQLIFDDLERNTLATINFSQEVIIENDPVSNSIVIEPNNGTSAVAVISPNVIYRTTSQSNSNVVAYVDPRTDESNTNTFAVVNPERAASQARVSDTSVTLTTQPSTRQVPPILLPNLNIPAELPAGQLITFRVSQLSSNLDNLQLIFGNQFISNFNIIEGREGSSFGSVRTTDSGYATVEFALPDNLTDDRYTVALTNNRVTAAAEIKIIDPVRERSIRDVNATSLISQPPCPSAPISGIAQSFLIEEPMMITGASVKIKTIGELSPDGRTLYISLVRMNGGIPTTEALAHGYLQSSDLNVSVFGELWSRVTFDRPAQVSIAGEYALVVTSAFSSVELFYGQIGNLTLGRNIEPVYTSIPVPNNEGQDTTLIKDFTNGSMFIAQKATEIGEVNTWLEDNTRDLAFQIYRAVPGTITAELDFVVENDQEFNEVEVFAPIYCPAGNFVQLFIKDGATFKLANNGHLHLNSSTTETTVKLKFGGNPSLFCLLDVSHTRINLFRNANKGTWVSIQNEFESAYTNVELSFEYYLGDGDTITPYFSSDSGNTWEELDLFSTELVDGGPPIIKATYEALNLTPVVNIGGINQERTKLIIRLDFTATDVNIMPYARRVATIIY